MVTPVAHALWVAGSLFLVLLGLVVLATRPGAWLNRVLAALLILRGASDLFYEFMRDAATPGEALAAHRIANWYDWATLLLTLMFLHYVAPARRFPRARLAVLGAAGALTVVLFAAFALQPAWFASGVDGAPGSYRVGTPEIPQAFSLLAAMTQIAAVLLAAREVGSADLTIVQRQRAAMIGLAFGLLLGQAGLHSAVALADIKLLPDTLLAGTFGIAVPAARPLVYGVAYVVVALALRRLASAFEGTPRHLFLGAGASALAVSALLALDTLASTASGNSLFPYIDGAVWRVPFVVLSAACLGLAVVRFGLAGFGAPLRRRVAAVSRVALVGTIALLPLGVVFALTNGDALLLGGAVLLALGAAILSPTPLRAGSDALSRLLMVSPGDDAAVGERARLYGLGLRERAAALGGAPPSTDPVLQELRAELGLTDRDHAVLVQSVRTLGGSELLLGRYRVERELGRGAFGTALLATDAATGAEVVLKRFHASGVEHRALAEARALQAVRHARVVPLLAVERVGAEVFLVLAYAAGGSAQRLVDREGPLPPERALALARDVLEGLAALHAAGLAHGDVKLSNVLLDADGRALLGDLGSARAHARPAGDVTLTAAGVLGSYATLAPELLRGGRPSPQADLYAVGAVLYQMLTGRHYVALEGKDPLAAAEAIVHDPPRLPDPRVPSWLEPVFAQALAKHPEQRFASAYEMIAALAAPEPRVRARGASANRFPVGRRGRGQAGAQEE